jgi:hypothetical protein
MSSNIGPLIDDFGLLKAQIADLETKAKALHGQIASLGDGAYEGTFYRVTVSESERSKLDMDAVKAKLSPQFIRAHTSYTPVTTVRVSGRNAIDVKTVDET